MPEAILDLKIELNPHQARKLADSGVKINKLVDRHFKEFAKPVTEVVAIQLQKNVRQMIPTGADYPVLAPVSLELRQAKGMSGRRTRPLKETGESSEMKWWKKDIHRTWARVYNAFKTDKGFPVLQAHAEGFEVPVTNKMVAYFAAAFPTVAFNKEQLAKLGGVEGKAGGRIAAALRGYRKFPPTKKDKMKIPKRNFYVVTDAMRRQAQAAVNRWIGQYLRKLVK